MRTRLIKSEHKMIAGICAGIAEYLGWNVTIVRLIYVLLTIFTAFAGVIVYIILWIVMPAADKKSYEERMNERLHSER